MAKAICGGRLDHARVTNCRLSRLGILKRLTQAEQAAGWHENGLMQKCSLGTGGVYALGIPHLSWDAVHRTSACCSLVTPQSTDKTRRLLDCPAQLICRMRRRYASVMGRTIDLSNEETQEDTF